MLPNVRNPSIRGWLAWLLLVAAVLALVGGGIFFAWRRLQPPPKGTGVPLSVESQPAVGEGSSLVTQIQPVSFNLSEGQPVPQPFTPLQVATGEPLSPEELAALLARLPELAADPGEQVDFRLPEELLPPPRPGVTIAESFPPPVTAGPPPAVESGPLQVLRFSPEGEVPVAARIAVTFNQPMVALTTLAQLSAQEAPLQIEPALPGTWRWLGDRTLTFEYASADIDRLPKATEYTLTVPAGTRSATGGVLEQAFTWTFRTPPLSLTASLPSGEGNPLGPVLWMQFDQRINPQALLETTQVRAAGQPVAVRLATPDEVAADPLAGPAAKNALDGRWLALRLLEPLPRDALVEITIGPEAPSAEGPLTSPSAITFSFRTYAPLRIVDQSCYFLRNNQCSPFSPLTIVFNNTLDAAVYKDEYVRVEPEVPGAVVNISGSSLTIQGATRGQTNYTVWLSKDLQDVYGQTLGSDQTRTFRIGPAEPRLIGPEQPFVTLDPAARAPVLSVYAINYARLELLVHAVQPEDWPAYGLYMNEWTRPDNPPRLPGRQVLQETINVESAADSLSQVDIDLSRVMDGSYGQFIVQIRPPRGLFQSSDQQTWQTVHVWVQVTQIGLDAFVDHSRMTAWATALKDGAPLAGVELRTENGASLGSTGPDGTANFAIPAGANVLLARSGADQAMLPRYFYYWQNQGWQPMPPPDELRWHVYDDRGMYRPSEEVHIKGWLRRLGGKQDGDVGLPGAGLQSVYYSLTDPQGNELLVGQAPVNGFGGFDFSFTLPEQVNLGYAQLRLSAQGDLNGALSGDWYHTFQIQEFRRPEFEVTARAETPGPYFAGESAVLAVEAKYYAGGPLPAAQTDWLVSSTPSSYSPPGWPEFTFGFWEPWWWYGGFSGKAFGPPGGGETTYKNFSGVTGADGVHYLRLDFDSLGARPLAIRAEATVMDVNRQAWTSAADLLVHPASLYAGLRTERYFVKKGEPLEVEVIVADLDGKPVLDRPVTVTAARLVWRARGGSWYEEEAEPQTCEVGSAEKPVSCRFETPLGGEYRIRAVVSDDQGRQNQTQFTRWVSGGEQPPSRRVEQEQVTLIPDRQLYQPGDTAEILVQAPFERGEGLLTVTRSGVLYTQRFQVLDYTAALSVPIEEAHLPNLNLQVDLVGSAPRLGDQGQPLEGAPPRPAYARGDLTLNISTESRRLSLLLLPEQRELEPGAETTVTVQVTDAAGQPVAGAEVALVVVDEAVLALSGYTFRNPLDVFYTQRPSSLESFYTRASLLLVDPSQFLAGQLGGDLRQALDKGVVEEALMEAPAAAPAPTMTLAAGASADQAQAGAPPIRVRLDFNPLAVFAPSAQTGPDGTAAIAVKLPDNLTRYRVMAAAVDGGGKRLGAGESSLTARLPLMARPSAPRFLNFGDRFELPVVLQNQTDEALVVDVALQVTNLALDGGSSPLTAGQRVTVPPRDRVEVRFPASTLSAGTARYQVAAVSGLYTDAASGELPVYTPATSEAFAIYGVVDEGAVAQPLESPTGVFPQYGGLEIQTSSTALQALTDAVLYLVSYPFECSEQLASRILAIASLRDVLSAFQAEGLPEPAALEATVDRDIERLRGLQNGDGGFSYWRRGQESVPFNSIHVGLALQMAQAKGFSVPAEMQNNLLQHLRQIESYYPSWYDAQTRRSLSAFAVFVRARWGDRDPDKALTLLREVSLDQHQLDTLGWLWPVLQDHAAAADDLQALRRHVQNRAVETAGAANFTTAFREQDYLLLASDRRTDAILLDALIVDEPASDLIPKLVTGLLAHRTRGRWGSTQENVFVLLALDRYFNTFESQTPDFVARLWLGETYAGGHEFRGRTTERRQTDIPMSYLLDALGGGTQNLLIGKEGPGRLYYRVGLRYAPTDLRLPPLDMGFVVQRRYEALDDPGDVRQEADGTWVIKAGARVRVRLSLVADNRRYHVALVDPLPAGLEIVNPALEVSGGIPPDQASEPGRGWWWWWSWFEHQNLRDERAEAFTTLLWEGAYEYTYVARATTPGTFVVPPAKAEEMYSPEVFGRSGGDVVIVE